MRNSYRLSKSGDLTFIAREMLRDSDRIAHAAERLGVQTSWPAQQLRDTKPGSFAREKGCTTEKRWKSIDLLLKLGLKF